MRFICSSNSSTRGFKASSLLLTLPFIIQHIFLQGVAVSTVAQGSPAAAVNFFVASAKNVCLHLRQKPHAPSFVSSFFAMMYSLVARDQAFLSHFFNLDFGTLKSLLCLVSVDLVSSNYLCCPIITEKKQMM